MSGNKNGRAAVLDEDDEQEGQTKTPPIVPRSTASMFDLEHIS